MPKSFRRKSYASLPALSVRGPALRASLQMVTAGWMVGVFWAAFIWSSAWEILGSMMGFEDWSFGLLQAAPYVATVFLLLGSILIERTGLTKHQFLFFGTVHRALWLLVAGVPLVVALPSAWAVWITLTLVLASWCAEAMCRPAWYTWMGVLIPPRIRGRYWARRVQLTTVMQAIAGLSIGYIVSRLQPAVGTASAREHPQLLRTLMILMAITGVCGIVDILMFRRIPEVIVPTAPRSRSSDPSQRRTWRVMLHWILIQPLRDGEFRRYVLCDILMTFAAAASAMYALRNMRINLGLNAFEIGLLFSLVGPVAAILSARFVGRAIDRWGPQPVMIYAAFGTIFGILPFLIAWKNMPGLWTLCIGTFIAGSATWGAFMMGKANVQLRFADREGASRYVSAYNFYIGIGGMLGGLIAAALTGWLVFLQDRPIFIGPIMWNNWHAAFALSMLARAAGAMVLLGKERRGRH